MTEKNENFIIANRESLVALFEEWNSEIIETVLVQEKGDEREFLIDFARFLKKKIYRIKNFKKDNKGKKETFV